MNLIYFMNLILLLIIQDYFECIFKKRNKTITNNHPVRIYVNRIKNRIVFKIKKGYKLELLSKETMKLLESTKQVTDEENNSENVPKLESVEVVLMHCNVVKNDYQQGSKVIFTFVPNKQIGQLVNISLRSLIMVNTINTQR